MVTCWERADLLALLYVMFLVFVTFPYGVLGQVWYFIVSNLDFCLSITLYIVNNGQFKGNVTPLQYELASDAINFLTLNSIGDEIYHAHQ